MCKILICIPCLYGVEHTREAVNSVINKPNVDVLLIDNGSEKEVKELLRNFYLQHNTHLTINPKNIYVNPAWQQGIDMFLYNTEYTHLIIMNSDLIMQNDWVEVLRNRWAVNPNEICIPIMQQSKELPQQIDISLQSAQEVFEGTAGVFITLSRKQVEIINPLPSELKIWFGDNWIFEILRGCGYKTVIPDNLISFHYWSQNVSRLKGVSELIEQDKINWEIVKLRKQNIIDANK